MAVKIKGMEMPKSCWVYPLQVGGVYNEHCAYTGESTFDNHNTRQKRCPLEEVK